MRHGEETPNNIAEYQNEYTLLFYINKYMLEALKWH